jgi:hypothetical protein
MATSIFFTESKDFKLIKDRILNLEDNYLVYVYADTTNIRIPRELIMQLPRYGNNLIWVDTAEMDSSELSHHIVLTIGQLVNPEEEIDFYIVSKSSKLEKTIIFLRNQGIAAEMIGPELEKSKPAKTKGTGRRGRPRKIQTEEKPVTKSGKRGRPRKEKPAGEVAEIPVKTGKRGRPKKVQAEVMPAAEVAAKPKKKRGRPSLAKVPAEVAAPAEPKKRGRKKIEKPVTDEKPKRGRKAAVKPEAAAAVVPVEAKVKKGRKVKASKEVKSRKPRIDKEITEEMVAGKLNLYETSDTNLSMVMSRLFGLKKVSRPKFTVKLIDMVKDITLEDDTIAEGIVSQLQALQILETGEDGRVHYKD